MLRRSIEIHTETVQCYICNEELELYNDLITYNEWIELKPICIECNKYICWSCITTCLDCWNEYEIGEDPNIYCINCNKLKKTDCHIHNEYICHKHINNKCIKCKANKNYNRYNNIYA